MSENLRNFTKALYGMDAVVQRVPDQAWDAPSPCEGWTARDVVGHQVGVLDGLASMARGNEVARPVTPEDLSNPKALWGQAVDGVLTALDQRGALQHHGKYWFGEMTIDQLVGTVQWDPLTHGWDLGQATGVQAPLDEGLAQVSFDRISTVRGMLGKAKLVGDLVEVPEDADIVSRYLALVGRDPGWGA